MSNYHPTLARALVYLTSSFPGWKADEATYAIYAEELSDLDPDAVLAACRQYARDGNAFAPGHGEIRKIVKAQHAMSAASRDYEDTQRLLAERRALSDQIDRERASMDPERLKRIDDGWSRIARGEIPGMVKGNCRGWSHHVREGEECGRCGRAWDDIVTEEEGTEA